jgi:hypothetical protein
MWYVAVSFLVFIVAAFGMALGSILGRRPIRSGCAAVARLADGKVHCGLCRCACDQSARSESSQCPGCEQGGRHEAIS